MVPIPEELAEMIDFQDQFFGDTHELKEISLNDVKLFTDTIIIGVSIRPFKLESIFSCVIKYFKDELFVKSFVKECFDRCPVLFHRLYQNGAITIDTVINLQKIKWNHIISLYFSKSELFIKEFDVSRKQIMYTQFIDHPHLDSLIKYGFQEGSIGYAIKYDDLESLMCMTGSPEFSLNKNIEWTPFEWSLEPKEFTPLAIASHFGSVKCFRYLLSLNSVITKNVFKCSVYGGNLDIIHLCSTINPEYDLKYPLRYCHESISNWFISQSNSTFEMSFISFYLRCVLYLVHYPQSNDQAEIVMNSSFHFAIRYGYISLVKYFLRLGANIEVQYHGEFY